MVQAGSVSLRDVSKHFGDLVAVRHVDLDIQDGEFLTLLGPSGCGKTTLLRMIAGFEKPSTGSIAIGDTDITFLAPEDRPLNMVFQRYALFPHLNVFDNVAYGLRVKGGKSEDVRTSVGRALEMVDMVAFADADVTRLSGGQSQRVALARALVNEPPVLLLDEPLGALDLQLRKRMQVELRDIQHRLGTTFIFVTHDQEEALAMSGRIAVFQSGDLIQVGAPEDVYRRPATRFVASFIGEGTLIAGAAGRNGGRLVARLDGAARPIDITTSHADSIPDGENGAVLIRPEHLRLVDAAEGRLTGRVRDRIFLGAQYRYLVILPDGSEAKADAAFGVAPQAGDEVGLDWDDAAAVWVREGAP